MKLCTRKVLPLVFVLVAASSLVSMFLVLKIDGIVHGDLYRYGLQFSGEWAIPYWMMAKTLLGLGWFNVIASVAFQIYLLMYSYVSIHRRHEVWWLRTTRSYSSRIVHIVFVLITASSLVSMFLVLKIDGIVHGDLYRYGLQFSGEWAIPYWMMARIVLGLGWLNVVALVTFEFCILVYRQRAHALVLAQEISRGFARTKSRSLSVLPLSLGALFDVGKSRKSRTFSVVLVCVVGIALTYSCAVAVLPLASPGVETYALRVSSSPPNGGASTPAGTMQPSGPITITATPSPGYSFEKWLFDSDPFGMSTSVTVLMQTVGSTHTLVACFKPIQPLPPNTWTVDISSSPANGGTTTPSWHQTLNVGDSITVTSSPAIGYRINNWLLDGVSAGTGVSVTIQSQTAGSIHTLVAVFTTSSNGINLIRNPSFATPNALGTEPDLWTHATDFAGAVKHNWVQNDGYDDAYCVGADLVSSGTAYWCQAEVDITKRPIEPLTRYRVRFAVKGTPGVQLQVNWFNSSSILIRHDAVELTGYNSTAWTLTNWIEIQAPQPTSSQGIVYKFNLLLVLARGGWCRVDAIELEQT